MTAEGIKKDIKEYEGLGIILKEYTDNVQELREKADNISIDSVLYNDRETGRTFGLAFNPERAMSVQTLIDSLEQHIKDIEREMADIRTKYKGVIDFEN